MNRIRRAQRPLIPMLVAVGLLGAACGSGAEETTAGGPGADAATGVDEATGSEGDSAASQDNDSAAFDSDQNQGPWDAPESGASRF